MKYEVQPGDTLWSIAKHYYGSPKCWIWLYQDNYDMIRKVQQQPGRRHLVGPDWIYPKMLLDLR